MSKSIVYNNVVAHIMLLQGHPDSALQQLPPVKPNTYTIVDRHIVDPIDIQIDFQGDLHRVVGKNHKPCLSRFLYLLGEAL
jgi:hypothetical protein